MREEFAIAMTPGDIHFIFDSEFQPQILLDSLFNDEENREVLKTNCLYYHNSIGSIPFEKLSIQHLTFDDQRFEGSLICDFSINHFLSTSFLRDLFIENVTWEYKICLREMMVKFWSRELAVTA